MYRLKILNLKILTHSEKHFRIPSKGNLCILYNSRYVSADTSSFYGIRRMQERRARATRTIMHADPMFYYCSFDFMRR